MIFGVPLLDTLERIGCGGILLDTAGHALRANETALRFLREHTVVPSSGDLEWVREALKRMLRAGNTRFTLGSDHWVTIRRDDARDLVLHAVPVASGAGEGPHTVVVMVDLQGSPHPGPEVLQKLFDLTPFEARLAIQITSGSSPAEVAEANGVTIATVRSQLASVFAKTRTGRQAELVALLARVAILP